MEIFLLVLRIILLVIGSVVALAYILLQFYQKVKPFSFKLTPTDYVVYSILALLFGFGSDSYYGLLAFVPLVITKFLCQYFLKPKFLSGSGRWMEVDWKKLMPKGFERIIPKAMLHEMDKMPKDAHFVIPKIYLNIFIFFMRKKMAGEVAKSNGALPMNAAQQNMAMGQFTDIINSITHLQPGQTERKNFPFGLLKVTRL